MRTTVTIDDQLYSQALDMLPTGVDKSQLFELAMQTFVQVQTAKRLVALGGQAPNIQDVPRRAIASTSQNQETP